MPVSYQQDQREDTVGLIMLKPDQPLPQFPADYILFLLVHIGNASLSYQYRIIDLNAGTVGLLKYGSNIHFIKSPESGYVLWIKPWHLRGFLKRYPSQEQSGIFDELQQDTYFNIPINSLNRYGNILGMIQDELNHAPGSLAINAFLDVLLLTANNDYLKQRHLVSSAQKCLLQLRQLISMHYILQRQAPFYAGKLGLSPRKLNALVRQTTGRDLQSLITSRLQTECESMLAQTPKPIKEIAFELGFNSPAHFTYFFRKQNGHTPKAFRKKFKQNITSR